MQAQRQKRGVARCLSYLVEYRRLDGVAGVQTRILSARLPDSGKQVREKVGALYHRDW
jgi:hypothetical protein